MTGYLQDLDYNMQSWQDSMIDVNIREGVMISHFEMLSDWNWYIRRRRMRYFNIH